MDSLSLPSLNSLKISRYNVRRDQISTLLGRTNYVKSYPNCSPKLRHPSHPAAIRMMAADGEDYELKQVRDMAAARKRWDAMAWVKGSTWIPIFDVDNKLDAGILSRKVTNFVMGGWWSGAPILSYDKQFLSEIEKKFPKDMDLIVACQKGLRSLAACELLHNAGYRNIFWVQGGFEAAEEEDLVAEGPQALKFAGIGGVSEFLGWTDQQRAAAAKEGWGYRLLFSARLVGVILVADALFFGAQQFGHYLQDIRSH
ncbi:rhodanese-like domain-containing protein 11 chloroplastic isoform X2 [Tripterygium wilfordii]|uniref:Rhodanese-like domain-containing protein 11 chloroplastic isoform X2 n=1 Tax=Tripterygium wilfordii TaxID=458696 RepID=A0A7J7C9V7_TRIWF|nr:rhodanese-like domain-containing protein 11, chloroplastic isoform X2 [Tripterygium wilfordii]KAF5730899.1 rhodanese-like domain-containing protein 11 chloroplastic isoform X2 [Tripterygium wilfordii]